MTVQLFVQRPVIYTDKNPGSERLLICQRQISIGVQAPVDPDSGMTVNLIEFESFFYNSQNLANLEIPENSKDFLLKLKVLAFQFAVQNNCKLEELRFGTIDDFIFVRRPNMDLLKFYRRTEINWASASGTLELRQVEIEGSMPTASSNHSSAIRDLSKLFFSNIADLKSHFEKAFGMTIDSIILAELNSKVKNQFLF